VDSLKAKLFEKLEQSLDGLQLTHEEIANVTVESSNLSEQGNNTESIPGSAHGVSATCTIFISVANWFSY
jgi:hypothetical protein